MNDHTFKDRLYAPQQNAYNSRILKAMFGGVVDRVWEATSAPIGRQVEAGFVQRLKTQSRYDD